MLQIDFQSEDFPAAGPVSNSFDSLQTTWDDLLWAAITVGRPNRFFVFRYGVASQYEALFRISAVRMSLEQISPGARRLRRTQAAKSLDPSEKGAVNYFLGLTLCKLFADARLNAPWLLHLDVFRPQLNPVLSGRSRPDLVGQTIAGAWVGLESKGRVSPPSSDAKDKAKQQAARLMSVNGAPVQFRIGAFAFFKDDVLRFYWRDPSPDEKDVRNPIRLQFPEDDFWRRYYQPILELTGPDRARLALSDNAPLHIEPADLSVRVLPEVMKLLLVEKWKETGHWCLEHQERLARAEVHGDGVQIIAGDSWSKPYSEGIG
jgi:hypothetical protein